MAMYQNGGDNKNFDVNTYGPSFINENNTRLSTSYWKNNLSISIDDVKQDEKGYMKAIDNSALKLTFSASTVGPLETIVSEIIDSIKATGKFEPEGVECGVQTTNFVEISDGSNINQPNGIYLVLYKDLDQNRKAKNFRFYKFNSKVTIKNYNTGAGTGTAVKRGTQELKEFHRILKEMVKAATKALAHSVKDTNSSEASKVFTALSRIAAVNGINLMDSAPVKTTNRPTRPSFDNSNDVMEFDMDSNIDFSEIAAFEIN